ncbi:hypothetical protein PVNG_06202 [Plasmodium vivax North Korean]|uniref:Variable surface protein Vir35 n=1 Tax=Plasmodium vivax North Korean TaxID=1035514 RepID=A0A0J9TYS8_PLAVI|nr:hypothetical protein PVNG_06202 [Plasmodium vivax North Korean]
MKDNLEYTTTRRNLKRNDLSDLDNYKKCYKNRYSKKKGLAKLDCYYEKKVFDKLDEIYELSRKKKNDKKAFKKKIYNKFGYRLIFFSLIPLLGIIYYIVLRKNGPFKKYCFSDCPSLHNDNSTTDVKVAHNNKGFTMVEFNSTVWYTIRALHDLVFIIFSAIVAFWIVYTLIKVIKYEGLKKGKGKMNRKRYINFCKEVFNLK